MSQTQMNLFTALRSAASVNIDKLTTRQVEDVLIDFEISNFDLAQVLELVECIASVSHQMKKEGALIA